MSAASESPLRGRRLLFFVYWLGIGGMEHQAILLARAMRRLGAEVTIGYMEPLMDPAELDAEGIRTVHLATTSAPRRLLSIPRFARLAREAELVHCTGWDSSLWGRLAGWRARRPVVVTEHSSSGRVTQRSLGISNRHLIAWHNRLLDPVTYMTVAVAATQLPQLRREGVAPRKLTLIPNGVPLEPIRAAAAAGLVDGPLELPEGARVVLQIGRFIPAKRQEWTLDAVRELREELGDVHVVFAGGGPTREALVARARAEGASWAHFIGERSDVPALLARADLAVLPSAAEALPMVMIEGFAVGVPLVATDAGDVGRVLGESGAGVAVGVEDRAGFVRACRDLLADDERRARMARAALAAADDFALDTMAHRYERLFADALGDRDRRAA